MIGLSSTPQVAGWIRFLQTRLQATGANYCVNRFAFGDIALAEAQRSVELFVRDVMPALRQS